MLAERLTTPIAKSASQSPSQEPASEEATEVSVFSSQVSLSSPLESPAFPCGVNPRALDARSASTTMAASKCCPSARSPLTRACARRTGSPDALAAPLATTEDVRHDSAGLGPLPGMPALLSAAVSSAAASAATTAAAALVAHEPLNA
eukprot:scaffold38800_cov27-Tisochrysis_lutea.AAC.1